MYVSVCFRNVAAPNDAFINSVLLGSIIDALLARLSMVRAGSCYLTSHALLENPRTLPEDPYVVYLDAIVRCSVEEVPLICSLRYVRQHLHEAVLEGAYSIFANVRGFFCRR